MVGDRDDYATWRGGSGELLVADVAAHNATKLKVLNGVMNGKVYLQSAGEIFQQAINSGKFQGTTQATTPVASRVIKATTWPGVGATSS